MYLLETESSFSSRGTCKYAIEYMYTCKYLPEYLYKYLDFKENKYDYKYKYIEMYFVFKSYISI